MVNKGGTEVTAAERIEALEFRVRALEARAGTAAPAPAPRPAPERLSVLRPVPLPQRPPRAERSRPAVPAQPLEDLLGGRVLAWVGGAAVVLGLAFLFALAISRGWIDETARALLGGAASAGLLALGVWLHERKARTDAALAATAAGIAGLFATLTVAGQVYDLLPLATTLAGAIGVGAAGTCLALRWDSRGIAALGLVGALMAPVLAGASDEGSSVALVFVAYACSTAVVLHKRWGWLSLLAFAVATPQWVYWLSTEPSQATMLLVLTGFAALGVVAAVGYELRQEQPALRISSAFLLGLNALVVGAAGWGYLLLTEHPTTGKLFLAALAAAHVVAGLRRGPLARMSDDLALLSLSIGVIAADVVAALVLDGVALTGVLAASGVGFAALARRAHNGRQEAAVALGLGGHLALAATQAVMLVPPGTVGAGGSISVAGAAALIAVAAGCLVSGRVAGAGRPEWRVALDVTGLATVAYLTATTLDGSALACAWAMEAVVLARIAAHGRDRLAAVASLCFAQGAAFQTLAFVAPPEALLYGLPQVGPSALALGAVALAFGVQARQLRSFDPRAKEWLEALTAAVVLYLASALIVTPFEVHQQGQAVLSVFWSLTGLGALIVGLVRDERSLRLGGLAVLLLAVGKVFLFDLATLDSMYRVASFVGLGVLLLFAAFVWQRVRPRALPDFRDVAEGVR